ncbi:MAG: hypothetical protein WDZ83_10725 [Rhizobiaceae bacterium]
MPASEPDRRRAVRECVSQRSRGVNKLIRPAVRNGVRVAVREDHDIAGLGPEFLAVLHSNLRATVGDQMKIHDPRGAGGQKVGCLIDARHRKPPRGLALDAKEDGSGRADSRQGLGKGVHDPQRRIIGKQGQLCKENELSGKLRRTDGQ